MKILVVLIRSEKRENELLNDICEHLKTFFVNKCDVLCTENLTIEMANTISEYDQVIFLNTAQHFHLGNFFWKTIKPADHFINTSFKKQIDPPVLLSYTRYVYGYNPQCFVCVIGTDSQDLIVDTDFVKDKLHSEIEVFLEERLLSFI